MSGAELEIYYHYSYQSYATKTFSGKGLIIFHEISKPDDSKAYIKIDGTDRDIIIGDPYAFTSSVDLKHGYNGTIHCSVIYL